MPTYNRTTRVKRGETGHVINVTLYEDNGDELDLSTPSTWTVEIEVTASGSATNLLAGTAMTVLNQVTYPGQATYAMTLADVSLAAGTYDLEVIATNPTGRVFRFPKVAGDTFGKLILMSSKMTG